MNELKELTDSVIISRIEDKVSNSYILMIMFSVVLFIIVIIFIAICIYCKKTEKKEDLENKRYKQNKKRNLLSCIGVIVIFCGAISLFFYTYNIDKTAIKDKNWTITKDIITKHDKDTIYLKGGQSSKYYYLYLKNYEKVRVSDSEYRKLSDNEPVYLVVVKSKKGKNVAEFVFSQNEYFYNDEDD